jgi:hypothetical protein
MAKERELSADEIVEVLEDLILSSSEPRHMHEKAEHIANAERVIEKLVGEGRQSESRYTTKHVLVDEEYCHLLADSCAISHREAYEAFIGEPIKYAEAIATWALEQADNNAMGLDKSGDPDPESYGIRIHAQRGRMVADILGAWAYNNQRGIYREEQPERMGTPASLEERV